MTYYTNSNEISELLKQIAEVEVKRLVEVEEKPIDEEPFDVKMSIFDNLFDSMCGQIPDLPWRSDMILWRRPDWGGMILELMKKNEHVLVFLFCGEWCRLMYNSDQDHFRFIQCSNPTMDADRSCLISTLNLTYLAREAIRDLMEPIRSGQGKSIVEKGRGGI